MYYAAHIENAKPSCMLANLFEVERIPGQQLSPD